MNEHLIADLNRFVDGHSVTLSETAGHVRLNIARSNVALSILIPRGVLEWWVEASVPTSGTKIEDCCDYAGYDASSARDMSEDMRTEVVRFIENVLSRPLRFEKDRCTLEWHVCGDWIQAVPLALDPDQGFADDVPHGNA